MVVAPGYSKNDYYSDCTHELGHAIGLEHTFKATPAGFGITQGSTNNYMDYVNAGATDKRIYFWQKQWEIIYNDVKSKENEKNN